MKNLSIILVALAAMSVVTMSSVQAQCGFNSGIVVNSGFNSFVPQQVIVPQSTAFFSGGNVAFVNQPQAFVGFNRSFVNVGHQRSFVNVRPVVQQVNVRRGLFGNVRKVQVRNFGAPAAVVVGGHGRGAVNVNVGRSRVFIR